MTSPARVGTQSRFAFGTGCLLFAFGPLARPAETIWPSLEGELTGEFTPLNLAQAPTLQWKLGLQSGGPETRSAGIAVDGPGTALQAEVQLDRAGHATWRIVSARMEVGTWFAAVISHLGTEFAGANVHGTLAAEGGGTWRDGVLGGKARFSLKDGRIDDSNHKLVLEGIEVDLAFEDLAGRRSAAGQTLTWTGGRYDEIEIGPGAVKFSVAGEEVSVEEASLKALGGDVKLAGFSFSLSRMDVSVTAEVIGIDVSKLLPLLPRVLAEARGRLNGSVTLRRDASGIQIGAGRLALDPGKPAELRLEPTPGLLSSTLPSAVLKYYPGLGQIETGEIPIQANLLEIAFTPEGDDKGRTAYVHLAGGPVDPKLRAPIDLEINVRGPLESLIKLGTSGRLRFGGAP